MSYLPVDALKTGGTLWFPDLTAADPYFILPVLCAGTMLLTIEVKKMNNSQLIFIFTLIFSTSVLKDKFNYLLISLTL